MLLESENPFPAGRQPAGPSQQCWACWPLPTGCPWHHYQEQTPSPLGISLDCRWHVPGWLPIRHSFTPASAHGREAPTPLCSTGARLIPAPPSAMPEELVHYHPTPKALMYARADLPSMHLQWSQGPKATVQEEKPTFFCHFARKHPTSAQALFYWH